MTYLTVKAGQWIRTLPGLESYLGCIQGLDVEIVPGMGRDTVTFWDLYVFIHSRKWVGVLELGPGNRQYKEFNRQPCKSILVRQRRHGVVMVRDWVGMHVYSANMFMPYIYAITRLARAIVIKDRESRSSPPRPVVKSFVYMDHKISNISALLVLQRLGSRLSDLVV